MESGNPWHLGSIGMPKTLIVIVSYNSRRYMQECIESIRRTQEQGTYGIVVVDNASTDGIREWLREQRDILLLENDSNVGFGPACNQAVAATRGTEFEKSDVFLLNNDTVVGVNSIKKLTKALHSADDIGAVGAVANYAGNRQQIDAEFKSPEEYIAFGDNMDIPGADRYMEKVRLNGFAMLVRRSVWDDIGGFDDDFAPGYYEDDALSIEILKRGYRLFLVRDSFIYHVGSASFVKTGTNRLSYEHYELFKKKYSFDILKYVYPSGAVISQIPFGRNDRFRVLQLGCGLGAELKAIRSIFPLAQCFGIETDKVLYDVVRHTEKVYESVVNTHAELPLKSVDLLIADSEKIGELGDREKAILGRLCKDGAGQIVYYRNFEEYPYDDVRVILGRKELISDPVKEMLEEHGIICAICGDEEDKADLKRKAAKAGFKDAEVLELVDPAMIPYLLAHFGRLKKTDKERRNAGRFRLLCKRKETDEISFEIKRDCSRHIDEILEIIKGAEINDSLKAPYDENALTRLIENGWNDCGYVTAGCSGDDYGIVAFFCYNKREEKMLYLAVSWLVAGAGAESAIEDAVRNPSAGEAAASGKVKILIKGICSLKPIENYLIGGSITTEYSDAEKDILPTKLFSDEFNIICYGFLRNYREMPELSDVFDELEELSEGVPGRPYIILLLGCEKDHESSSAEERKLSEIYREMNPAIEEFALDHDNFRVINTTDFVRADSDFGSTSNEFSVGVYSGITEKICEHINEYVDEYRARKSQSFEKEKGYEPVPQEVSEPDMGGIALLTEVKKGVEASPEFCRMYSANDVGELLLADIGDCSLIIPKEDLDEIKEMSGYQIDRLKKAFEAEDCTAAAGILDSMIDILRQLPDKKEVEKLNLEMTFERHELENTVMVVGDSHTCFFSGNEMLTLVSLGNGINVCPDVNGRPFTALHLGPCLAYNSNRLGSSNGFLEKVSLLLDKYIAPGEKIVFSLGEIDMRVHVFKQAAIQGRDYKEIVDDILANYFDFLKTVRDKGYKVYVWGPIASQRDIYPNDCVTLPRNGSEQERNMATAYFTQRAREISAAEGIVFMSIFDQMVDDNYMTDETFICADHWHLGQAAYEAANGIWKESGLL